MKKLNAYELMGMIKAKQLQNQKGATMIEYAIVVGAIVAVAVVFFGSDGTITNALTGKLTSVATDMNK